MRHTLCFGTRNNVITKYGNFAVSKTATEYGNFAVNGWCSGCGRKFTPEGRCPNCDAWWASPLVRVGGPLLALTLVLLVLGIQALRPQEAERPAAPVLSAPREAPASPASPLWAPQTARVPAPEAPLPPLERYVEPAPQTASAAVSQAEQMRLRQLSAYVDAVIAADEAARARREAVPAPAHGGGSAGVAGF